MQTSDEIEAARNFLAQFITKMNTQDNRRTATPYYYVIQSSTDRPDGHDPEWYEWHDDDWNKIYKADSEDDLVHDLTTKQGMTYLDAGEHPKKYTKIGMCKEWREHCCFFIEEEAVAHLKANHYHYSKDARTYVKHFWRAPQIHEFFRCVGIVAGVPFTKK